MTVYCFCGRVAEHYTSRTPQNQGRRFFRCPEQIGCGFFIWEDMYLWITEGGKPKTGKKKQVWLMICVCVAVIWFLLKTTDEVEGSGKALCKCSRVEK